MMKILHVVNNMLCCRMPRALAVVALLGVCLAAMAQTESARLVVWLKNGQKVYHDLADKPETRFNVGYLMLSTDKVSVTYPLTDVLRYTYEGNIPVVSVPDIKPGEMRFQQGADEMRFDGLAAGTVMEVYSSDGKLLRTQKAVQGQTAVVSLKGQPTGLYIVKIGDASYKFMKR